jgi:hypothetical protein
MITLKEYKNHLIEQYRYEIDNVPSKREERKTSLERQFSDAKLQKIINDTYSFIKEVLSYMDQYDTYWDVPIPEDTTSYISLNLTGGYHSDTLYKDDKGRTISHYIIRQIMGDYFYIDVKEQEREIVDGDIVGFDYDYSLYMQGFPNNKNRILRKLNYETNEPTNVIFLDFDGTLYGMHDPGLRNNNGTEEELLKTVEKRIAILSDVCKTYNCKIVISSGGKVNIDEHTMEIDPEAEYIVRLFDLFKKYGIECIGRTPDVRKRTSPNTYIGQWKEDEIRLYLFRHPEIIHYCVLDDEDTIKFFHWNVSDLEKVRGHLVSPIYYNEENPDKEGLQPEHKEEIGRVLQKENEIRKLALRSIKEK